MLADIVVGIYYKCRIYFLMKIFSRFENREATLTTVESFSMECIQALGEPTVAEFAAMMGISAPNAAYKVNSLIQKGYIEKVQSKDDRREFFLRPTKKFMDYYNIGFAYGEVLEKRCRERFSKEDLEKLESMMRIISEELMPELDLGKYKTRRSEGKNQTRAK